jgi:hypothetical protein
LVDGLCVVESLVDGLCVVESLVDGFCHWLIDVCCWVIG